MAWHTERTFFQALKGRLAANTTVRAELEAAIHDVLNRYNTSVWENRFIVGGVVEQIIGSAARAVDLRVRNAGKSNQQYDLELDGGEGLSIKGVFASVRGNHNLINTRGALASPDAWTRATIFVMSGTGVGYIDPEFGRPLLVQSRDALQISGKGLQEWWSANPDWLIADVEVPRKPKGEAVRVASDAVSWDVLQDRPLLRAKWEPEI